LVFEVVKRKSIYSFMRYLSDRLGLAEVIFLHGHTTASVTNIFHGRQLVFADMLGVRMRCPAEAALGFVVTGVAKMAGCIGYCAAIFTCICHLMLLSCVIEYPL
jgi:hypothetical protein